MSCVKSQWIQIYDDQPIEGEDVMEFRLLYSGQLLGASKTDTRAEMKHAIRREFHPQLRRLWDTHHGLQNMAFTNGVNHWNKHPYTVPEYQQGASENEKRKLFVQVGLGLLSQQWERVGYKFIPLVIPDLYLRCAIEILFLRPEEERYVVQSGDLDAKVKTIFDALRLPDNLAETGGIGPQDNETPFYCLLSDDKLISEIRVTTEQLLALPKERSVNANDAFLVITVKLLPIRQSRNSYVFA